MQGTEKCSNASVSRVNLWNPFAWWKKCVSEYSEESEPSRCSHWAFKAVLLTPLTIHMSTSFTWCLQPAGTLSSAYPGGCCQHGSSRGHSKRWTQVCYLGWAPGVNPAMSLMEGQSNQCVQGHKDTGKICHSLCRWGPIYREGVPHVCQNRIQKQRQDPGLD